MAHYATVESERDELRSQVATLQKSLEQEQIQHAGCLTAAEGWAKDPPKQGDWAWSPAFQTTLNLYAKYEALRERIAELEAQLKDERLNVAIETSAKHGYLELLSSVESQRDSALSELAAARKDTERLDWLENYVENGRKNGLITNLIPNGRTKDIREAIDAARAPAKD